MQNADYWAQRFRELEEASHRDALKSQVEAAKAFQRANSETQRAIEAWYARYAKNNDLLSLADAKKQLSAGELEELKWDVQEYIKRGRENAVDGRWMRELENASAKFHISRLEELQLRTQQAFETAFGKENKIVGAMAEKTLVSGRLKSMYEIQKGIGQGWQVGNMNSKRINELLSNPWASDGKTFSDRIWEKKNQMVGQLQQEMTRTLIQGKSPAEAISHLSAFVDDKVNNAKYAAGRLVMTEQAFFQSAAQKEAFADLDVEEYEIVATLDSHTSEICQEMDGQHFPLKDHIPGSTAPPFHVNCRSTTCPYFDDEFSGGERAARGADGETYYVPADMTYKDWEKTFVEGDKSDELTARRKERLAARNKTKTQASGIEIAESVNNKQRDLIESLADQYNTRLQKVTSGAVNAAGSVDISGAHMSLSSPQPSVAIHEFAHTIASSMAEKYGLTKDADFWKEIRSIRRRYAKDVGDDTSRWISSYEHSSRKLDEFFAEAFTHAKMREMGLDIPSTYGADFTHSQKVLDVVDKHFGKASKMYNITPRIINKDIENIVESSTIKLSNEEVRKKYLEKVAGIKESIDQSLPIEEKARIAFEARNKIRTEARNMMADTETRKALDKDRPNKTFEELLKSKMNRKNMSREEAIRDIYETATKTNENVNRELGVGG